MTPAKTLPPVWRTVRWPVLISLAVLAARLAGELLDLDPSLFSKEAGGRASLVGVSWLIPLFGFVFGWMVTGKGRAPDRPGLSIILHLLGLAALIGGVMLVAGNLEYPVSIGAMAVVGLVSILFAWRGWSELLRYMLVYGLVVRLAVIAVTAVAFPAEWGTHFEKVRPEMSDAPTSQQFVFLLSAQALLWIPGTVLIGGVFGSAASMVRGRRVDDVPDH